MRRFFWATIIFSLIICGAFAQEEVAPVEAEQVVEQAPAENVVVEQATPVEAATPVVQDVAPVENVAPNVEAIIVEEEPAAEPKKEKKDSWIKRLFKKEYSRGPQDNKEHWGTIDNLCDAQMEFGLLHNGGFTWSNVTRIQKKSDVSNFVWTDKMAGVYYELQSHDLMNINKFISLNFMGRMAIYYPYRYRFRGIKQIPKQMMVYSLDWFTAPVITFNIYDWVRIDVEPGLHLKYQMQDKWNYWNLGPGIKLDVELPISSRWTVLMGSMFSWDNGNLGSNRHIRDFDYVWEWQFQFGVRYSKKHLNRRSYIKYKPKRPKTDRVLINRPLTKEVADSIKKGTDYYED